MKYPKFTQKNTRDEGVSESLAVTLLTKLLSIKLPDDTRAHMRENLQSYATFHSPVEIQEAIISPYSFGYVFSYISSHPRRFSSLLVLVLVLVGGFGVSSHAEKAQWENILTNRRLSEATTLALQNKLATSTQMFLAQEVATHVALAQQDALALSNSGDTASAASVRTDLTEKLSTNADALATLGPQLEQRSATSTVIAVAAMLRDVHADIDTVALASGSATTTHTTNEIGVTKDQNSIATAGTASTTEAGTTASADPTSGKIDSGAGVIMTTATTLTDGSTTDISSYHDKTDGVPQDNLRK